MTATATPTPTANRAARRASKRGTAPGPPLPPSPVITSGQLSADCGIPQSRLQALIPEGLPAYQLTEKMFVFDRDEAVAWLIENGYLVNAYRREIKRLVDAAPPLTAEQAAKIRAVLAGPAA